MSIQWTIVATVLYAEIAAVLLLLIPFISPSRWQRVFKSKALKSIERQSFVYFTVFIVILLLFFIDAVRDVRKYSVDLDEHKKDSHAHVEAEMQIHMKLFRAQRNFYISGFALFLWLVLRRLTTLISSQATLMANSSAAMQQAQSATERAKELLEEKEKRQATEGESADNAGNIAKEVYEHEIQQLKLKLSKSQEELSHSKKDLDAIKKQSESVSKEYDRLLKECDSLRKELETSQGLHHDKKTE